MNRKRINPTRSEGQNGDDWERLLADVRGHIWEFGNFNTLAKRANLSNATVSNLAYADTRSPHMRTVIKIMTALGKSDPILNAFKTEKPVTIKAVAGRWITRQKLRASRKANIKVVKVRASQRRKKDATA